MKYLLNILFILFVCNTYAQLTLTNLANGTPIVDGDVFNFNQLGSSTSSDGKLAFKISNSSATETIRVLGQMVSFTNTNGGNCQFCVEPECFFAVSAGQTIPNVPIVLAPGDDNGDFDSFYNTDPGDGVNYPISYTFRFFMLDDNGNEVGDDISVTYNYSPNISTRDFELSDLGIDLENTVVTDYLYLNNERPVSIKVFDLTSRLVKDIQLKSGRNTVEFSNMTAGYYFTQFTDDNNRTTTVKILKQ